MSVNYGMVEETRRLGVAFKLVEAGGYPNLERQRAQIKQCVAAGADVLVVGTVSFKGLTDTILEIARDIPVSPRARKMLTAASAVTALPTM